MTPRRGRDWLLALGTLAACAGAPPMPEPPATHPASPAAMAAPVTAATDTLTMPERQPKTGPGNPGGKHMRGR